MSPEPARNSESYTGLLYPLHGIAQSFRGLYTLYTVYTGKQGVAYNRKRVGIRSETYPYKISPITLIFLCKLCRSVIDSAGIRNRYCFSDDSITRRLHRLPLQMFHGKRIAFHGGSHG